MQTLKFYSFQLSLFILFDSQKNHLETFLERVSLTTIRTEERSYKFTYKRLNHEPFQFSVALSNPSGTKKRVIVRIMLGNLPLKKLFANWNKADPREMIR